MYRISDSLSSPGMSPEEDNMVTLYYRFLGWWRLRRRLRALRRTP
jgi:hypothetical protein